MNNKRLWFPKISGDTDLPRKQVLNSWRCDTKMEGCDRHMRQDRVSMLGSKGGREEVDYRDTPVSKYGCFTLIRVSNYD